MKATLRLVSSLEGAGRTFLPRRSSASSTKVQPSRFLSTASRYGDGDDGNSRLRSLRAQGEKRRDYCNDVDFKLNLAFLVLYRAPGKSLYMVARYFFLLLLNCSAWPCLGPA